MVWKDADGIDLKRMVGAHAAEGASQQVDGVIACENRLSPRGYNGKEIGGTGYVSSTVTQWIESVPAVRLDDIADIASDYAGLIRPTGGGVDFRRSG